MGIKISETKEFSDYQSLAMRLDSGYRIALTASDSNPVYKQYRLAKTHVTDKAETALVESYNGMMRHNLARFNRKTKRYSKALDMVFYSILLMFNYKNNLHLASIFG